MADLDTIMESPAAIEYDEGYRETLETTGMKMLRGEFTGKPERCECNTLGNAARYNTCLRFVTLHSLRYDWNPDTGIFTIHPPA